MLDPVLAPIHKDVVATALIIKLLPELDDHGQPPPTVVARPLPSNAASKFKM